MCQCIRLDDLELAQDCGNVFNIGSIFVSYCSNKIFSGILDTFMTL